MSLKTSKSESDSPHPPDYWDVFQDLPQSYLLFEADDPTYTIVDLNKARERLTGIARAEAIGRPLFEVYPNLQGGENTVLVHLRKLLKTGKPQKLSALRYPLRDRAGIPHDHYWESTYLPLRDASGAITHIVASTEDVTEEVAAYNLTHDAEQRLKEALSIGKVGSWLWDLKSDKIIADPFMAHLFGVDTKEASVGLPLKVFQGMIHPEDRDRVMDAVKHTLSHHTMFESEYRLVHKGKVRWVLARGRVEERSGTPFFPGVIVDITERRDLQAQVALARQQDKLNQQAAKILQERNEELEAISRTKDEFVALASHQLRTPATAVKQYVGMVLQGYVGEISEVQTEMLEKAFESNERQIQIINQILNAARVDTGRLIMSPVPMDAGTLVQAIINDMDASIRQRGHQLEVHIPKKPLRIIADQGYLRMAIENILHNASIYTPNGGTIRVELTRAGKHCRLNISDTGVGIKKADLAKLFVKFSRIHNPLSVQAGGSGIGLYLSNEIIRLHGGSIDVDSRVGKGTTFAISLPLLHNKVESEAKVLEPSGAVRNITNMRTGLQTGSQKTVQ